MTRVSCILAVTISAFATLVSGSALARQPPAASEPDAACSAPSEVTRLEQSLVRTAARIAQGQPLKIVALGSSSTAGYGASSASQSYPNRLEDELRLLLPERDIVVVGASAGGVEGLMELTRGLPRSFAAAVFIVLHTSPQHQSRLANVLSRLGVGSHEVWGHEPHEPAAPA